MLGSPISGNSQIEEKQNSTLIETLIDPFNRKPPNKETLKLLQKKEEKQSYYLGYYVRVPYFRKLPNRGEAE